MIPYGGPPDGTLGRGWQVASQTPAHDRGVLVRYRFGDGHERSVVIPADEYHPGTIAEIGDALVVADARARRLQAD